MVVTRGTARAGLPPVSPLPSVLTIGNFDGVHLGHQAMIARVGAVARAGGLAGCVLTFEPHPREFFNPVAAPTRLTSLREKLELLAKHGIARTHVQRFTRAFAALSPEAFVEKVLVGALSVRWLLIGADFRFGAKRAGDLALLETLAARHGFEIEVMRTVERSGTRVSSSAVREALAAGELAGAQTLLGRPYSMSGRVVHGDKLGRELGFATANVQMRHNRPPLSGIFAVRMHGAAGDDEKREGEVRDGVASLGVRPTVKSNGLPVLEVHLLDYSGNLYGRHVRVEFLHKIRDEAKYPDLGMLRAQIARDCDAARAHLAGLAMRGDTSPRASLIQDR